MASIQIKVPDWLDHICAWPVMAYRRQKYGYTFRRIDLGQGEWTLLDEVDYYRFGNLKWSLGGYKKNLYAVSGIKNKDGNFELVRLHRLIMNPPENLVVDHRNGDGLDNRRENLRLATKSQNLFNSRKRKNTSSQFIGVSFDKRSGLWVAYIGLCRKKIFLGYFKNEIDAAKAYDAAAKIYHGEFARLNFPEEN